MLRFFRDRSNFFFVFVLPLAIIILIGAQFGGGFAPRIGFATPAGDALADEIVAAVDGIADYGTRVYANEDDLVAAVGRGSVNAGVVVPDGFTAAIAEGATPEIGYVSRPDSTGPAIRIAVEGAVAEALGPAGAARTVSGVRSIGFDDALDGVTRVASQVGEVTVASRTAGESLFGASGGQFDVGATTQLVLFMFLTGLTGSAALIQNRQLGVTRRMLGTPASSTAIVVGEGIGRMAVAVFQGVYIALVTWAAFQVQWGDLVGVVAILLTFGLVGAGAAMLMGAVFRNDQQAGGVAVVIGIGLAALGGSMVPLEVFSPTMQTIAKFTPHAWANEAFAELVRRGGTVADILPELGVLLAMGVGLMLIASWRLRRVITRA